MNKLKAVFAGLLLVLSIVASASATEKTGLAAYPAPFITDGKYVGTIVVGDTAKVDDVLGSIDIAAALQAFAKSPKTIETSTAQAIEGGVVEKIMLGQPVNTKVRSTLTKNHVAGLQDTTISLDDKDYDVHDEIVLANGLRIDTSLTANDEDYGKNVYMEITRGAIVYKYVFDESIDLTKVDDDNELTIEFLGKTLTVTQVDGSDRIRVRVGKEMFLKTGDETTVDGHKITLDGVSTNEKTVALKVDGVQWLISTGGSKKISNGLEIGVKDSFSSTSGNDAAILVIGSSSFKTYQDGDAYIGEDENDPTWIWVLKDLDTTKPLIGVSYDLTKDNYNDNPVKVGGCYKLPENFASICLNRLTEKDYANYRFEFDGSYDKIDDVYSGKVNEDVFVLTSSQKDGFKVDGVDTNEVVLWNDNANKLEVFYYDLDDKELKLGEIITPGTTATIGQVQYQDTTLDMVVTTPASLNATDKISLVVKSPIANDDLKVMVKNDHTGILGIGDTVEKAESSDLVWGTTTIGTRGDSVTQYGVVVENPDSSLDNDRVNLNIPGDVVEAEVVVSGMNTSISNVEAGYVVNQFKTPAAKLASEVSDSDKNLIVIGGPCVNSQFEKYSGISCDKWTYTTGQAVVKLVQENGRNVLLVAGTTATDTRNACDAIINHQLTGTESFITGTSLFDYTVSSAVLVNNQTNNTA